MAAGTAGLVAGGAAERLLIAVLALRQLLFPLLAAALLAPYFRRSQRVKRTFVHP